MTPNGVTDLQKRFKDIFQLVTVYVTADENVRRMRSISRGDLNFEKRNEDENKEFSEFENCIQDADIVIENNNNINLAFQELVLKLKENKVL